MKRQENRRLEFYNCKHTDYKNIIALYTWLKHNLQLKEKHQKSVLLLKDLKKDTILFYIKTINKLIK